MAPHPSTQFLEAALSRTGDQFELSYTDPDQKLHVRDDLLSLIREFPNFVLSMDSYTHNDGSLVNLICAITTLRVSNSSPPVPITIWVHEDYPRAAPMSFVDSSRLAYDCPISCRHPYVDPSSGLIASPYIHSWDFPRSNLRDLVRNLVKLFSLDHPVGSGAASAVSHLGSSHCRYVSKNEAIDRLAGMLHLDITGARSETDAEVEGLFQLQRELAERAEAIASGVSSLKLERRVLWERFGDLSNAADDLVNWLKDDNDGRQAPVDDIEESFKAGYEESKMRLQCEAGVRAVEDTIYALDEAVSDGIMGFEDYTKQVRVLAREQFYFKAMLIDKLGSKK